MPRKLIVLLLAVFLMAGSIFAGCGPSRGTVEWHVNQACKLAKQGHYDEAIEECNRAIVLNPDSVEAYNNRAVAYRNKGQYDLAIADCNKTIALDPNYVKTYCNRAVAYCNKGQYNMAIADCNMAIELEPKMALAYNNRAYAYNNVGQYDLAIADCNRAIELSSKLALAYNNRAYAYNNVGQYDLAIADRNRAIELDPSLAPAYNRASAYKEQGREAEAIAGFEGFTTLTDISGGPQDTLVSGISPSATEELSTGEITVNATLDGVPWSGEVSYTIQGPTTESGSSVPQSFGEFPIGIYTVTSISGGPQGTLLSGISLSATEELSTGEAATLTLAFVSTGGITVKATLDGVPWSGEVSYTIQGPTTESGSSIPQSFGGLPIGTYSVTSISGGPQGAILNGISPSATEELSAGEAATLTLPFVSTGGITVEATLDGVPWFGHVNYMIEGPRTQSGSSIPQGFSELPIGTYTVTSISGGPQGAILNGISPSATEELSTGEVVTFTLVFICDGKITVNATLDGIPWTGQINYTIEGPRKESGSSVPQSFIVPNGAYTITHNSGGPQFEPPRFILFGGISPSATEEISPGEAATFTLAFVSAVGEYGRGADLSVTNTVDNATPNEGDTVTYTITITNNGPDAATNIEITDILPVGVTYVSDTPSQGTYSHSIWNVGALKGSGNATLQITAIVDINTGGSTINNTAEVTSVDQADPDSTPNNNNTDEDDQDIADIKVRS